MGGDIGIFSDLIGSDVGAKNQSSSVSVRERDRDSMRRQRRAAGHTFDVRNRKRACRLGNPLDGRSWRCRTL